MYLDIWQTLMLTYKCSVLFRWIHIIIQVWLPHSGRGWFNNGLLRCFIADLMIILLYSRTENLEDCNVSVISRENC